MTDRSAAPRKRLSSSNLPKTPPGTDAELTGIVRLVFGLPARGGPKVPETAGKAVEDEIRHLAADILGELRERAESPKLREEVERLESAAKLARELRQKLSGMDGLTSSLLNENLRSLQRPLRLGGKPPPPVPSAALVLDLVSWSAGSIHPLEALARAAESTCEFITQRTAARSGSGMKRGAEKFRGHLMGDVRVHLAFECAQLLGAIQGAKAVTATEGGKLYSIAAAAWRYATGLDVEATGGGWLSSVVKRVAPIARRIVVKRDALHSSTDTAAASKELILAEAEAHEQLRHPPARVRRPRAGQGGISPKNR